MSERATRRFSVSDLRALRDAGEGRTDWERLDGLDEAALERAIADDPDSRLPPLAPEEAVAAGPGAKQAVSLRLDRDVLAWFRAGGAGYQTRMNAVLRRYVQGQRRRAGG